MPDIRLNPLTKPFTASLTPPGSKSLTNRALVLAALGKNVCTLRNALFADDTLVMIESLTQLGFQLEVDQTTHTIVVHGQAGNIPRHAGNLFCGNSGTSTRFLTALCCLGLGTYKIDGIERMRQRPIAQLAALLKNLGARIEYLHDEGFPPVVIHAHGLAGGIARFGAAQSSQFLSAVIQVCPYTRNEVHIDLDPHQTSWPYVAMTMQLMDHFGVTPELIRDPNTAEPKQIIIPQGVYHATEYDVEPDASNASYFLAAAAISPGSKVTIEGLGKRSLQGDIGFADLLHRMGAGLTFGSDFITILGAVQLEPIEANLATMPDMAQTLAVVALFAKGQSVLRGLHTLRLKETDRVAALATELRKLGATVEVDGDDLIIDPPDHLPPAEIDTYDDHRMAMSFAVAGTRADGVTIKNAECVNKTYPGFFEDLKKLRAVTDSTPA